MGIGEQIPSIQSPPLARELERAYAEDKRDVSQRMIFATRVSSPDRSWFVRLSCALTPPPWNTADSLRLPEPVTTIHSGHWMAQEKPFGLNAVLVQWLVESRPEHWPKPQL